MEPVIAFRDVSYGIRGKEVLRHLDLEVAAGETLVLLGRSGSGKTTALKMVNALLTPISGDARVEDLLARLGLPPEEFRSRTPRQLSGGQRQRVGVARALAAEPSILLMDEPFGALDPVTRRDLQRQFLALRKAWTKTSLLTSLFVTHDVREALALATRIALLHEGRLEIVATPREFLAARTGEARSFLAALEDLREA